MFRLLFHMAKMIALIIALFICLMFVSEKVESATPAFKCATRLSQDIGYMSEALVIHANWVWYLQHNPNYDTKVVGDVNWHREWVRRYDLVIAELYKLCRLEGR